jgi:hypothetical protein
VKERRAEGKGHLCGKPGEEKIAEKEKKKNRRRR